MEFGAHFLEVYAAGKGTASLPTLAHLPHSSRPSPCCTQVDFFDPVADSKAGKGVQGPASLMGPAEVAAVAEAAKQMQELQKDAGEGPCGAGVGACGAAGAHADAVRGGAATAPAAGPSEGDARLAHSAPRLMQPLGCSHWTRAPGQVLQVAVSGTPCQQDLLPAHWPSSAQHIIACRPCLPATHAPISCSGLIAFLCSSLQAHWCQRPRQRAAGRSGAPRSRRRPAAAHRAPQGPAPALCALPCSAAWPS